jgi:hypothetical protein
MAVMPMSRWRNWSPGGVRLSTRGQQTGATSQPRSTRRPSRRLLRSVGGRCLPLSARLGADDTPGEATCHFWRQHLTC